MRKSIVYAFIFFCFFSQSFSQTPKLGRLPYYHSVVSAQGGYSYLLIDDSYSDNESKVNSFVLNLKIELHTGAKWYFFASYDRMWGNGTRKNSYSGVSYDLYHSGGEFFFGFNKRFPLGITAPYLSLGIGGVSIKTEKVKNSDFSVGGIAYCLGIGSDVFLNRNLTLLLQADYTAFSEFKFHGSSSSGKKFQIKLGLSYFYFK